MSVDSRPLMDAIYGPQRHIYDLTRKFYLLGRDPMIAAMNLAAGQSVCEIGCGTARNLIAIARACPGVSLYGLDASSAMLETASSEIRKAGLVSRTTLRHALAEDLTPGLFGREAPFDHIVFSYSLSMIPGWADALDRALDALRPGGVLHAADFGDQRGLPRWFSGLLTWWLKRFHVTIRMGVIDHLAARAAAGAGRLERHDLYRGYAYRLRFVKS